MAHLPTPQCELATQEQDYIQWDFPLGLSVPATSTEMEWDDVILGPYIHSGPSSEDMLTTSMNPTQAGSVRSITAIDTLTAEKHAVDAESCVTTANRPSTGDTGPSLRPTGGSSANKSATNTPIASISDAVCVLSDLSVELHKFGLTIPPIQSCMDPSGEYRPLENTEFAIDCMLKLSQRFIEVLNQSFMLAKALRSDSSSSSAEQAQLLSSTRLPMAHMDEPCELLVISCYMRIVETYCSFLQHVSECAKGHLSSIQLPPHNNITDSYYRLPALRVGSFTMESTTSTHVSLLVHMIEAMMTRCRVLIQSILQTSASSSIGDLDQWNRVGISKQSVAQAALERFRPQEDMTMELLTKVRRILIHVAGIQWTSAM